MQKHVKHLAVINICTAHQFHPNRHTTVCTFPMNVIFLMFKMNCTKRFFPLYQCVLTHMHGHGVFLSFFFLLSNVWNKIIKHNSFIGVGSVQFEELCTMAMQYLFVRQCATHTTYTHLQVESMFCTMLHVTIASNTFIQQFNDFMWRVNFCMQCVCVFVSEKNCSIGTISKTPKQLSMHVWILKLRPEKMYHNLRIYS